LQGTKSSPVALLTGIFWLIYVVSHLWDREVLEERIIESLKTVFYHILFCHQVLYFISLLHISVPSLFTEFKGKSQRRLRNIKGKYEQNNHLKPSVGGRCYA